MATSATRQLGIIGYPIGHALSPLMYNAAIEALGLNYEYHSIGIPPENLETEYHRLLESGFHGLNVTLPHKQAVIPYLDDLDATAEAIGAVNTIEIRNGRSRGYNTDALGFLRSVEPAAGAFHGNTVLLLGAGGAARAVFYGLITRLRPSEIIVAARTTAKAETLISDLTSPGTASCRCIPLDSPQFVQAAARASVIINATPVGMHPNIHENPLSPTHPYTPNQLAVDLVYNPIETVFLRNASLAGSRTLDGLGMLIYQGAEAFRIFTGHEMPLAVAREALEKNLIKN